MNTVVGINSRYAKYGKVLVHPRASSIFSINVFFTTPSDI